VKLIPLLLVFLAQTDIELTSPDHPLSVDASYPLVEPHLAVSPVDPQHLVVGAIVAAPERSVAWYCSAFVSRDGGETWARHDLTIDRCIDPWVSVLADGSALLAAIEIRRDVEGDERFRLVVYRSVDGGMSWPAQPIHSASSYEHPILAASNNDIYLTARRMRRTSNGTPLHKVGVERSTDGGRSFEPLAEIGPSDLALNPTGLTVEGDRIVVTFIDFQRNIDGFDRAGMLEHPRAWALVSTNGGRSFEEPKFVSESCGMKGGFPGYPFSTSGPTAGRIYFTCVRPGFEGLVMHVSNDGGTRWSDPVRVDRGTPHARTPMLAVNRRGIVGAAWYDRRHDPERECQQLYFTASVDEGESFLDPIPVSTVASCPKSEANGGVAESWPMGGDYTSLAAGPDGAFHIVWADSRSGQFRLRAASLRVRTDGTGDDSRRESTPDVPSRR
jgi:hypothetical protein